MYVNNNCFVSWEERIICPARGNRVVHFYLKDALGESVLAVIGTERSIRHMTYVVSDEFMPVYLSNGSMNVCTKWRARRDVVDWLTTLVSQQRHTLDMSTSWQNDSTHAVQSFGVSTVGPGSYESYFPHHVVSRKLKAQNSNIEWLGVPWICTKQLKHYPAFCKDGTTIAVHSFVFIMAVEETHYLGYLEDMYEDKKGQKKVKVRWFHYNYEVTRLVPQLNSHPREVFITPHVQVIIAECIDRPAIVLNPKHYKKFLALVAHRSSSGVHLCFRKLKNNRIKPFALTKLHGYSSQAILTALDSSVVSKHELQGEDKDLEETLIRDGPVRMVIKRKRCYNDGLESGSSGVRSSNPWNRIMKGKELYPKLKLRISRKEIGIKVVGLQPQYPLSFQVDAKIELLCQDSGIRGCWFRCKVLQSTRKKLKVRYDDLEDVDGTGNLEEWVPACRMEAPDKLGMRCPGRTTIRPCPPESFTELNFEVGAAVDAWWSDGWWEGIVIGVDSSRDDILQVYFPGEEKFLTFQRKDVRPSRDWFENRWVDIKARQDIHCYLSKKLSPSMEFSVLSTVVAEYESKSPMTSKLEAVQESREEEDKDVKFGGNGGSNAGNEAGTDNKIEVVSEKDLDSTSNKCEATEAT